MARACAIPQFTHRVPGAAAVFARVIIPEVIGMTAGTIRLVGRAGPGRDLAITGMAIQACNA